MSVYAISDLHGCLNLFRQVQNFIQKDDVVFCLGDCCDRGPDPWETVKAVLRDDRFIYLKGNHEDMLVHAMEDIIHYPDCDDYSKNVQLVRYNGGRQTLEEWKKEKYRNEWFGMIKNLPLQKDYLNENKQIIHLSHAGFSPQRGKPTEEKLLWDRNHIFDTWFMGEYPNEFIVHGHTPTPLLVEDLRFFESDLAVPPGMLKYCSGHKFDIDCGSFYTGKTTLLDLDTFEEYIFYNSN